jgi:hypothetical protein
MATKKITKTEATKATKGKKSEPTFNSVTDALNAPFKRSRSKAEVEAAHKRAQAKGREIDERRTARTDGGPKTKKPDTSPKVKTKKLGTDAKPKRLSAIDAAAKLLAETGEPMTCKAMVEAMTAKGYWTSPAGKTPHATLYTAVTMLPKAA